MLNFVICDDSEIMLNKLSKMFDSIFINRNINGQVSFCTTNYQKLLDYMIDNPVDAVVLDIQLKSDINGLEVARKIREINKNCYLIFTTGHLEYSLVAYKLKTFDYIAKPVTTERLEETVIRLLVDMNGMPKKYIKIDAKNTLVDESEVQFIKREGMKLVYHTPTRDYEAYSSFNKIQDKLPENFVRCHKSFIANLNNLVNIEPVTNTLVFSDSSVCYIGPKYKKSFMEVINSNGNFK